LLGRAGRDDVDRFLRHSLTYALIELDDYENTRAGLTMENPNQVIAALYAISEMPSGKLKVQDVLPLLDSKDETLLHAAVSISANHPEWDAALANRFFEWSNDLNDLRIAVIKELTPVFIETPPILDFIGHLLEQKKGDRLKLGFSLIAGSPGIKFQDSWTDRIGAILGDAKKPDSYGVLIPALTALANAKTTKFDKQLIAISEDNSASSILRIHAMQARANPKAAITAEPFEMLVQILKEDKIYATRAKAISILTNSRLTVAQKTTLAGLTGTLNPLELPPIAGLFTYLKNEEQARILAKGLAISPGFRNLDPVRLKQIFAPFDKSITAHLDEKIAEAAREKAQRKDRIAALKSELAEGDVARGKIVFDTGKGTCIVCHKIGETGRDVGPNMSTIGRIRKGEDLLESILFPSESLARDFETFTLTMKDGSPSLIGLIRQESAEQIDFIDPAGQPHVIKKDQIASVAPIPQSLMPVGLDLVLGKQDLLDLVTYLLSLK